MSPQASLPRPGNEICASARARAAAISACRSSLRVLLPRPPAAPPSACRTEEMWITQGTATSGRVSPLDTSDENGPGRMYASRRTPPQRALPFTTAVVAWGIAACSGTRIQAAEPPQWAAGWAGSAHSHGARSRGTFGASYFVTQEGGGKPPALRFRAAHGVAAPRERAADRCLELLGHPAGDGSGLVGAATRAMARSHDGRRWVRLQLPAPAERALAPQAIAPRSLAGNDCLGKFEFMDEPAHLDAGVPASELLVCLGVVLRAGLLGRTRV